MIRKLSLLLTVAAALGLVVALSSCGRKGPLEPPPAEPPSAEAPAPPAEVPAEPTPPES